MKGRIRRNNINLMFSAELYPGQILSQKKKTENCVRKVISIENISKLVQELIIT